MRSGLAVVVCGLVVSCRVRRFFQPFFHAYN